MRERRKFDPEFKARVVLEMISGQKGLMAASREYRIKDSVLSRWKQEFLEKAAQLFEQPKEEGQKEQRIAELEQMVGRLTMQLEMAKKVLRYSDSPAGKRAAVKALQGNGYAVERACELLGLAHSTYYYARQREDESQLEADVARVVGQYPTYGTRRVTHQLRRLPYAYGFNRKRIQGLMRRKGWLRPVRRVKFGTTNSKHPYPRYANLVKDLLVSYPNEVWVADITYIRLGQGFVFLAIVLDVFTRTVHGWKLSNTLDQDLSLGALRMGLAHHVPQIHHSDQGIQYAAHAYTDLLNKHHIYISMAAVGKAEENGYAERFMRTIKEEEVDLSDYRDFADAQHQIGQFIQDVYNTKRIHSSLGYLTPVEFESAWRSSKSDMGTP